MQKNEEGESVILTLKIDKIEPGNYRARVLEGREELDEFGANGIAAAIRQCSQAQMPDLSGFHIWYEHVCAGTIPMSNMRIDPEGIAQRLMTLHGALKG
ncbi:hypothetical protein C380_08680 [Acidovorax sp. KKS102]|uniref:hypothetical protein n=1 Tax=Acidovorax sp. KKS102 TaxID=358220 RepID=UPI00028BBDBF|nr:hypothetical protein [Acidovorax sp. KKS102]AFU45438.1 hypothetical protein C380_08680 [Acidovorax sp. KKS102]